MKLFFASGALVAAGLIALSAPALAHVSFETAEATQNRIFMAVLRVPHGCNGEPTLEVRVRIPEGVIDVKPMPKAGWGLTIARSPSQTGGRSNGKSSSENVRENVREIAWSGSLADAHVDEFVFQARITDAVAAGKDLAFPVAQICQSGAEEWTDTAVAGQDAQVLKRPAPAVKVVAAPSAPKAFAVGAIRIDEPWSRATPAGAKVGGGYLRITNTGSEPDRLVGGTFPSAARVELHEMSLIDDVMRMRQLPEGLEIKPGQSVELKPGGHHLMFLDLNEGLNAGRSIVGTLVFEKAGPVDVTFEVRALAGGAPSTTHQHH